MIEDVLDVTTVYLKRVNLFIFYNGCTFENIIVTTLGGNHSASAIHDRLKGEDEIHMKCKR